MTSTNTAEFRKWFGNSKVIDANGNPLVVYHGTDAEFSAFRPSESEGVCFIDNEHVAADFGERIVKAYLSIQKPYRITYSKWLSGCPDPDKLRLKGYDGYIVTGYETEDEEFADEGTMCVVFRAEQIKSADNDGTWDRDDANIMSNPKKDATATLYHVTFTKNVTSILKSGITPLHPSNWIKGTGDRYGEGEIYAFEHTLDAMRWASRMEWSFHTSLGTGKISIVEFIKDGGWAPDTSDPISQLGRKGLWLKKHGVVKAADIVEVHPFTKAMVKRVVAST